MIVLRPGSLVVECLACFFPVRQKGYSLTSASRHTKIDGQMLSWS
jgi:hypothetical protein